MSGRLGFGAIKRAVAALPEVEELEVFGMGAECHATGKGGIRRMT